MSHSLYNQYKEKLQKIADVKYANAVLQWDQETYLPNKGAAGRARQLATLSEIAHTMSTDVELGNLLQKLLNEELNSTEKKNVELSLEDYEKQQKFSGSFVRKMSETISTSFHAWMDARKQNNFSLFEKALDTLIELKKEEADILGYTAHPYDALLNEFEKGATVKMIDKVFDDITPELHRLLNKLNSTPAVDDSFLKQYYPKQQQWEWGLHLLQKMGFDFEAGRQDISEHPFTTNFSSQDVRLTTRIDENDFSNMTWSCIHELGHGLYEQGLPAEQYGLPLGEFASLSIHESQSRIWENCIGRSKNFWQYYLPEAKKYFPNQLQNIDIDHFFKAINKVQPSLIRTEADELTYHFHIMIRYRLEKELIAGNIKTKDIPAYWNEQYFQHLGVKVPDDKRGCLQDVHWSHGSFGYFATYSLGSFYAAQLWISAQNQLAGVAEKIAIGETSLFLSWLRTDIHQYGRQFTSEELCTRITGEPLNSNYFIQYLEQKLFNH